MRQYLPSVGAAVLGLIGVVLGLIPVVDSWPRWLLVGVGLLAIAAASVQIVRAKPPAQRRRPRQNQRAGNNSRMVQAAGDIHIEGGLGDNKR